jgi:hypothetical protein
MGVKLGDFEKTKLLKGYISNCVSYFYIFKLQIYGELERYLISIDIKVRIIKL